MQSGDTGEVRASGRRGAGVSCVICAFNEADRISAVLDVVCAHPAVAEVVVVDDGSTDGTDALLRSRTGVRVVAYGANRGKSFALSRGFAAATGDHVLLLDADLDGLDAAQLDQLLAPVLAGAAEVSMSLRRNSLALYRWVGLDFVSGERVIPASLVRDHLEALSALPPWGGEAFLNGLVIESRLRLAVVDWAGVYNVRKGEKVGFAQGVAEELRMVRDALAVLSPWGALRQNLALLRLKQAPAPRRQSTKGATISRRLLRKASATWRSGLTSTSERPSRIRAANRW